MLPPGASLNEKTPSAVAARTGLSVHDVARTLRSLDDHDPPVVHRDIDATTGTEFWIALERAIAAVEDVGPDVG